MASKWFVFCIAMFVIASINDSNMWPIWLFFAAITGDPTDSVVNKVTEIIRKKNDETTN